MKLVRSSGQRCTFRVNGHQARQASLVIDIFPGISQIFPLQPVGDGVWETELQLQPGEYRFCYHLYDGRSLQYVTPADMKIDGLKAVLHVKARPTTIAPPPLSEGHTVFRRRLRRPLSPIRDADPDIDDMLRRVAG